MMPIKNINIIYFYGVMTAHSFTTRIRQIEQYSVIITQNLGLRADAYPCIENVGREVLYDAHLLAVIALLVQDHGRSFSVFLH